jgi:hypothetical protein
MWPIDVTTCELRACAVAVVRYHFSELQAFHGVQIDALLLANANFIVWRMYMYDAAHVTSQDRSRGRSRE